jgi:flagella basal body P-ring formation protein FlgA
VSETFDAVVPVRDLAMGQMLQPDDVTLARRPKAEFGSNALTGVEQVHGYSLKHPMRAGQAIRQSDLTKPELVARNETVTIVYQVPGITLTVIGKAADPGALGDTINVLNVQSKRTIQATVIGPNRVSVAAGTRLAADITP